MPPGDPRPPTGPAGPACGPVTRRAVLRSGVVAGAGAALTACGLLDGGEPAPGEPGGPAQDAGDLAAALALEEELLDAHGAAVEAHPSLGPRLDGVRADHEEHRRVLRALLADLDPAGGRVSAGPASSGSPVPASPAGTPATVVPADPAGAVAALRALEQDAASVRTEQAVRADARWAPLLGVLAASEAAHAAVLTA